MHMENYRFIEKIGRGTHGTAYLLKSHEKSSNRLVVCKSVLEKYHGHAHREISILGQLNHRRVVRKLDDVVVNGSVYIILEYANYGTLENMIHYFQRTRARPGPGLGWSILSQVSDALYYIHSKRVIHRDIKPANILVNKFWVRGSEYLEFKLCDFSLSTVVARGPGERLNINGPCVCENGTVGTPFYMAPEVVERRAYGATVDVWGLGVVLYEALSLTKPFKGANREKLYREIVEREVQPGEVCSDASLSSVVLESLGKAARPTARELAKKDNVRLHLTMLELRYRESRIEALEKRLSELEK
ncbi:NIMA (never in mitosis gene a)-related kinase 6 [Pancytospora philotis]|nr:NIMA (never in mitosis gene a)-related kinase 6 [Pancytospora philotis]